MIPQDLHIHTTFSTGDSAVVKEQTVQLIKQVHHANIIGISDHYEYLLDDVTFDQYRREMRAANFRLGTDLDRVPSECGTLCRGKTGYQRAPAFRGAGICIFSQVRAQPELNPKTITFAGKIACDEKTICRPGIAAGHVAPGSSQGPAC